MKAPQNTLKWFCLFSNFKHEMYVKFVILQWILILTSDFTLKFFKTGIQKNPRSKKVLFLDLSGDSDFKRRISWEVSCDSYYLSSVQAGFSESTAEYKR